MSLAPDFLSQQLNSSQKEAFDAIRDGKSIFLTGPGGTGKSFLLRLLYENLPRLTLQTVSLTALTGCAALLLHSKAKTIHSWAGIGLGKESPQALVTFVRKSRKACLRWLSTDVLVIDEISMMTPELFEKLDYVGRKIRKNDSKPFGGLQLVLVGDFYQLPPVVRQEGDSPKQETAFVFESPLWKQLGLITHELTEIVRQRDPNFQIVLNEARRGEISKKSLKILASRMGQEYRSLEIQPTMLFTRRAQVDDINNSHLRKLTTERKSFKASTIFQPLGETAGLTEQDPLVQKAIMKFDQDAPYSADLTLAVGAQVMLVHNLNPEEGLVNGSRGVVIGYSVPSDSGDGGGHGGPAADANLLVPVVQFRNGLKVPIAHGSWEVPDMPGVLRRQIPLKLAYAITIHKAQGATLDCALIDVGGKTFEYGQAYVALSRVKDIDSLFIHDLDKTAFRAHPKVKEFYGTVLAASPSV